LVGGWLLVLREKYCWLWLLVLREKYCWPPVGDKAKELSPGSLCRRPLARKGLAKKKTAKDEKAGNASSSRALWEKGKKRSNNANQA
jgi:hypothetical protein